MGHADPPNPSYSTESQAMFPSIHQFIPAGRLQIIWSQCYFVLYYFAHLSLSYLFSFPYSVIFFSATLRRFFHLFYFFFHHLSRIWWEISAVDLKKEKLIGQSLINCFCNGPKVSDVSFSPSSAITVLLATTDKLRIERTAPKPQVTNCSHDGTQNSSSHFISKSNFRKSVPPTSVTIWNKATWITTVMHFVLRFPKPLTHQSIPHCSLMLTALLTAKK